LKGEGRREGENSAEAAKVIIMARYMHTNMCSSRIDITHGPKMISVVRFQGGFLEGAGLRQPAISLVHIAILAGIALRTPGRASA